jgi:cell division protein FtsI/penicillin-binding protein 2
VKKYYEQKNQGKRIIFLLILSFILGGILIIRLFQIQVLEHENYKALAEKQHWTQQEIPASRGTIYVRDKNTNDRYPLATNITRHLVYAVPPQIKDKGETAKRLAPILQIKEDEISKNISDDKKFYVILKHKISDEETNKIKELKLSGIFLTPEPQRIYPENSLAAQLLGFVNNDGKGQYGIEGYFDKQLKGKPGTLEAEKDVLGTIISWNESKIDPANNGNNIILTIDRNIQYKVEKILEEGIKKHGADSGSIIVMEPKTGKILAMASSPSFDPNKFSDIQNYDLYKNAAVSDVWEPGSIFKVITMASALNEDKVNPETTYTDTGSVVVDEHTIHNSDNKANGVQTMTQVLEKSLNTGVIFAKDQIGNNIFYNYLKNFGFGVLTGVELDGESKGDIPPISEWSNAKFATAAFGQGIAITPIQMSTAVSAIANGGKLMKPQIIEEIDHPDGSKEKVEPKMIRQIVSPNVAAQLGGMMVQVVENGHGYQAKVPGYYIAGKTGTAQVPLPSHSGYDPNKTIGSFAGFAPVNDPKFAILVKIDVPKDVIWAESSAAPIFGEVAKELLNYYKIPPSR